MRLAHDAGMSEKAIAEVTGRSGTAVHFRVTSSIPGGSDPASRRRAAAIEKRLKADRKPKKK
jgi:hypothetical protein